MAVDTEITEKKKGPFAAIGAEHAYNVSYVDPWKLTIVGRDTEDGPEHVLYDPRALNAPDPDFTASIIATGVNTPIRVQKDGDRVLVVVGRQRVINAREAQKKIKDLRVPITNEKRDDNALLGIQIEENEQRIVDDVLAKAQKAARRLQHNGNAKQVCREFRITAQTLHAWQDLLAASPEIQEAVRSGQISLGAARKLGELSRAEQAKALQAMIEAGTNLTVGQAVQVVENTKVARGEKKSAAAQEPKSWVVPTKHDLKALVAAHEKGEFTLSDDFVNVIRWILGKISPQRVTPGLKAIIDNIRAERAAKKQVKQEAGDAAETSASGEEESSEEGALEAGSEEGSSEEGASEESSTPAAEEQSAKPRRGRKPSGKGAKGGRKGGRMKRK